MWGEMWGEAVAVLAVMAVLVVVAARLTASPRSTAQMPGPRLPAIRQPSTRAYAEGIWGVRCGRCGRCGVT